ncbi:MAG: ribonuclease P [Candidatus Thermoplasmatota archaeon]|nr:ribonuclease P [Candidatus Thermoplasmatota archaeon]
MSRKQNGKKQVYRAVARRRIQYLFSLAETCGLEGNFSLANRYVQLARRISMKYLVPIPKEYSPRFCKYCYAYQLPPETCRVRIHRGMIISYCTHCQKHTRRPLHRNPSMTSEL